MIRVIESHDVVIGEAKYYEFSGLSTDTKPVGGDIATGSTFLEVNTGSVFVYDETGDGTWKKV